MKNRQTRIIIGALSGLVLFSSGIALLMYSKQSDLEKYSQGQVEVYVAASHLNRGDLIAPKDIQKASLPKSYLAFTPLTKSEIIGRYANVEIFTNEPLRKEKLTLTQAMPEKAAKKVIVKKEEVTKPTLFKRDTITIPLSVFRNIDSTLKKGDNIDILSIIPKRTKTREHDFSTKYIALDVSINSFVKNGALVKKYITEDMDHNSVKSDSVVLEMVPSEIKNLLSLYYKTQELNENRVFNDKNRNIGNLWMVKCSNELDSAKQSDKKRMMADYKASYVKRKSPSRVSISYEK